MTHHLHPAKQRSRVQGETALKKLVEIRTTVSFSEASHRTKEESRGQELGAPRCPARSCTPGSC